MKKLLPIGVSDFKNLIDEDYYYVDKTLLIDELKKTGAKVVLIPRPRRFGKTLNLSMLRYFYEKSETNNAYLFEGTAIWQHKEYHALQGTHPVIFISFKDCKKLTWNDALDNLKFLIAAEFKRHASYLLPTLSGVGLEDYKAILERKASQTVLENSFLFLSKTLEEYHKKKVIVLLDEYDTPIRTGFDNDYFKQAVNFTQSLLGAGLEDNNSLERGILTGTQRFVEEIDLPWTIRKHYSL